MLKIRAEQLARFETALRTRIKRRVIADVRAAPPEGVDLPSNEALEALLDRCEASIDAYGGDFVSDAPRYLLLALELGEEFPAERWAAEVFEDRKIPGTSKLDMLTVHARLRGWAKGRVPDR